MASKDKKEEKTKVDHPELLKNGLCNFELTLGN